MFVNRFVDDKVFVTTPRVNATGLRLSIEVVLNDGTRIDTGRTFEYHSNPEFTDINPRNHLIV